MSRNVRNIRNVSTFLIFLTFLASTSYESYVFEVVLLDLPSLASKSELKLGFKLYRRPIRAPEEESAAKLHLSSSKCTFEARVLKNHLFSLVGLGLEQGARKRTHSCALQRTEAAQEATADRD